MKTIRWGIIGCGNVTEVKSGPGFQKAKNSALVAVMRRNGALAEDYARRHNVPRWTDDAQALIDDPEVDAVYVATPPAFHIEYTIQAARAGKPVYVEKPLANRGTDHHDLILCHPPEMHGGGCISDRSLRRRPRVLPVGPVRRPQQRTAALSTLSV